MFITRLLQDGFRYRPDDDGGNPDLEEAESPEEQAVDWGRSVKIGDKEVRLEDMRRTYEQNEDWKRSNTQKAQELAERERALNQRLDKFLDQQQRPKEPPPPPKEPLVPLSEALKSAQIDPVSDEDWLDKLGKTFESREARIREEEREAMRKEFGSKHQELEGRLKEETSKLRLETTRTHAMDRLERSNRETLERGVKKFSGLALSDGELRLLGDKARSMIGDEYGTYNQEAREWQFNETAVEAAAWAVPQIRNKLLAQETGRARSETISARRRGEEASASTPGRLTVPRMDKTETAVMQKAQRISEALKAGTMSEGEARAGMSDAEWATYYAVSRRQARAQARAMDY